MKPEHCSCRYCATTHKNDLEHTPSSGRAIMIDIAGPKSIDDIKPCITIAIRTTC